jgi:hypothetical protein
VTGLQLLGELVFFFLGGCYCGSRFEAARVVVAATLNKPLGLGGKTYKIEEIK